MCLYGNPGGSRERSICCLQLSLGIGFVWIELSRGSKSLSVGLFGGAGGTGGATASIESTGEAKEKDTTTVPLLLLRHARPNRI